MILNLYAYRTLFKIASQTSTTTVLFPQISNSSYTIQFCWKWQNYNSPNHIQIFNACSNPIIS